VLVAGEAGGVVGVERGDEFGAGFIGLLGDAADEGRGLEVMTSSWSGWRPAPMRMATSARRSSLCSKGRRAKGACARAAAELML